MGCGGSLTLATVERSKSRFLTSVASFVMRPKGGRRVGLEMVRFGMTGGGRKESLLKSCRLGVRSKSKSRPRKAGATKSGRTYESDPATFVCSDKLKTNDRTARNSRGRRPDRRCWPCGPGLCLASRQSHHDAQ